MSGIALPLVPVQPQPQGSLQELSHDDPLVRTRRTAVIAALSLQNNNVERAADWIFSHADELDAPMETDAAPEADGAAAPEASQGSSRDGSGRECAGVGRKGWGQGGVEEWAGWVWARALPPGGVPLLQQTWPVVGVTSFQHKRTCPSSFSTNVIVFVFLGTFALRHGCQRTETVIVFLCCAMFMHSSSAVDFISKFKNRERVCKCP